MQKRTHRIVGVLVVVLAAAGLASGGPKGAGCAEPSSELAMPAASGLQLACCAGVPHDHQALAPMEIELACADGSTDTSAAGAAAAEAIALAAAAESAPPPPPPAQPPDDRQGAYLYRAGTAGPKSFTPRPAKDTDGWPDNGLSAWNTAATACRESPNSSHAQVLDWTRLDTIADLMVRADQTTPGHYFLAARSQALHLQWAATRDDADVSPHPLTDAIRATIVATEDCPPFRV